MSDVPATPPPASADTARADAARADTARADTARADTVGADRPGADRPGADKTGFDLLLVPPRARTGWRVLPARVAAMCVVELQKLRHDRTELYTRAIQPALWLLIFGETFTRIKVIPTDGIPYLDYLAPGIIAQSTMFIAIFYGIQIIWERDSGVLTKLLVTPTPRAALVTGKAFAAGVKAMIQAVVVVLIAALLGVSMTWNPVRLAGVIVAVLLGSAFFSCLSVTIAGIVLTRDRLMGIGQAITMPLFFASNALYPTTAMPDWLRYISVINPLSYQVDALRGLLLGIPANLPLDFVVLIAAAALGITAASGLLGRLAR
ncbi:ABC transporter permease [Nonomuraea sp. NPDC049158]|uniref:ABC transporter permease n=1 Tax=Nonomuraea sp. NPDC049158 TaxID=3155649 RepID=UPI0033E7873F